MENLIEVTALNKTYSTKTNSLCVLDNLNFSLKKGEVAIIHGQSGSGKSTLLNIIGGLDAATNGKVIVDGEEVTLMNEKKRSLFRRSIGFIFQFHYLLSNFSVLDNAIIPLLIQGERIGEAKKTAIKLLESVGLGEKVSSYPSLLSGGEAARVALVRAIVTRPKLILADEPTGNLDPLNALNATKLLFSLVEESGVSLVFVTHDRRIYKEGASVYKIEDKKLVEDKERE